MIQKRRVLIFSTVWPEPQSSAAGVRLMQWVNLFLKWGYDVTLSSPSQLKEEREWGHFRYPTELKTLPLPLNQSSTADQIRELAPDIVLFDRFILEEQFGHQVYEVCPQALILLETQDLHFVRRAREELKEDFVSGGNHDHSIYKTETALRETAAIYRVDKTFVVSAFEAQLLDELFGIGKEWVEWIPFLYDPPLVRSSTAWADGAFEKRSGFSWVGNFRHAPNVDGLRWFRQEIWPLIRARIPSAQVNVWGAYPTAEVMQFHQPKDGFLIHGHAEDLDAVFANTRVNLAPLRFGAGIKGKILEGFRRGIPVATTSIGSEGLAEDFEMLDADEPEAFAERCIELHENPLKWKSAQANGKTLIEEVHSLAVHEDRLKRGIENLLLQKKKGELPRWLSQIGRHEQFNSHRYFSKWIELKESK